MLEQYEVAFRDDPNDVCVFGYCYGWLKKGRLAEKLYLLTLTIHYVLQIVISTRNRGFTDLCLENKHWKQWKNKD